MLRIWEREEDKAAPSVPEDRAKAAEGGKKGYFLIGLEEKEGPVFFC
jgi:hypothetical protein